MYNMLQRYASDVTADDSHTGGLVKCTCLRHRER